MQLQRGGAVVRASASQSLLMLMPGGDPYFANVVLLMSFDGNYADKSSLAQAFANSGTTLSATGAKFTQSVKIGGTSPSGGGINAVTSSAPRAQYSLASGDYTIECWVNPATAASAFNEVVLSASDSGAGLGTGGWLIKLNNSGAGTYATFINGSSAFIDSGSSSNYLVVGSWNHIACTRQGSVTRLFINGVLAASVNNAATDALVSKTIAVGNLAGLSLGFDGAIDEVRVTKGVARYTASFTPPAAPFQNS